MLDLVSTRSETDQQSAACARLLTTVIVQAIRDAGTAPLKARKTQAQRDAAHEVEQHASEALAFLFDADSIFPLYAGLIGSSVDAIRHALLYGSGLGLSKQLSFKDMNLRTLRTRHRMRSESLRRKGCCEPNGCIEPDTRPGRC